MITTNWTEYPSNPIYNPGKAYYPTIIKVSPTSYIMWSDCVTCVQMATSTNGISWTNVGICTGLLAAAHCQVLKIGSSYRVWYWNTASPYGITIRTATSVNGLTWTADQWITQVGTSVFSGVAGTWNYGSYGPITILYNAAGSAAITVPVDIATVWANKYVMYYDGTQGGREVVGLAVSNNGINWQGYLAGSAPVLNCGPSTWDNQFTTVGTVAKAEDGTYQFWYSGGIASSNEGIGYASSADGIVWVKDVENPVFHKTDGVAWRNNRTYTPCVIENQMWFSGRNTAGVYAIGMCTGNVDPPPPTPGSAIVIPKNKAQVVTLGTRDGTIIVPRYNDWS